MGIFDILKRLLNNTSDNPKTWRETVRESGYGIQKPAPNPPQNINLCSHLNVSEPIRKNLESFLVEHWASRAPNLVEKFMQIAHTNNTELKFPEEIAQTLNSRRKRGVCTEKQIAAVYIQHELNVLNRTEKSIVSSA